MTAEEKEAIFEKIHAMDVIMRSLNDEDELCVWWLLGVPDGTDTLEDVREMYDLPEDDDLRAEFAELSELFARIVVSATAKGKEVKCWIC